MKKIVRGICYLFCRLDCFIVGREYRSEAWLTARGFVPRDEAFSVEDFHPLSFVSACAAWPASCMAYGSKRGNLCRRPFVVWHKSPFEGVPVRLIVTLIEFHQRCSRKTFDAAAEEVFAWSSHEARSMAALMALSDFKSEAKPNRHYLGDIVKRIGKSMQLLEHNLAWIQHERIRFLTTKNADAYRESEEVRKVVENYVRSLERRSEKKRSRFLSQLLRFRDIHRL